MLFFTFATCLITMSNGFTVSKMDPDSNLANLTWPTTYTVKASKMILTSGLHEEFTAWRTSRSSRVDYNHGAVKRITLLDNGLADGDKYEIYPETTVNEYNTMKCMNIGIFTPSKVKLDTVLPEVNDIDFEYEPSGKEVVMEKETEKFYGVEYDDEKGQQIQRTIWAQYGILDNDSKGWIPVRYELKVYNIKFGELIKHVITEYFQFSANFEDNVFDIYEDLCNENVKLNINSEAITRDLFFIDPQDPEHVELVFKSFKNKFGHQYTDSEHEMRKVIFQKSMEIVSSVNRKNLGYKLSINEFADCTEEEMKSHTGLLRRPSGKSGNIPFPYLQASLADEASSLPSEYDLRLFGLVSPVKNQGPCGSCWTFGTTAAVEGALARVNGGRLLSLANQALLDCAWDAAAGCHGGSDDAAYEWMMKYGLPTEEEYGSYANVNGFCNIKNMTTLYPIRGYTDVLPYSTEALKVALVNHGPLSVSVHVSDKFKLYSSGIFYEADCNPSRLNHEVTLVGYGERDGETFWILKNSWGPNWGVEGFMYIAAKDNVCGVETEPTYVVF